MASDFKHASHLVSPISFLRAKLGNAKMQRSYLSLAATMMALSAFGTYANAEESPVEESPSEPAEMAQADGNVMEETFVLGRLQSAAQSLLQDRIEDDALVDSLDSETISRMGDSTVAASLRRVSGLTLVKDKFV